jgi:hypothetical protein
MDVTLTKTWEMYAFITQRQPDHFYEAFATKLYVDMFQIGNSLFQNSLMDWLAAHSSAPASGELGF